MTININDLLKPVLTYKDPDNNKKNEAAVRNAAKAWKGKFKKAGIKIN